MKSKNIVVLALVFLLGYVVSSLLKTPQAEVVASLAPARVRNYAMNVVYSSWAGWNGIKSPAQRLSDSKLGVQISFGGPLNGEPSQQIEELEPLLQKKVNGIVLFASDAKSMTPMVNRAVSQGIPIVTLFGDAEGSNRLTFISADDRGSARRLTERVAEKFKSKFDSNNQAKVLLCTSKVGIQASDQRVQGVKDALAATPWMKLVDFISDENDDAKSTELISAAWTKHNGLDVIIGVVPRTAIGAIAALKERQKKPGEVTITGWDRDDDVLQGIKDGWILAVSTPKFDYMTQLAISILEAHNLGYLYPEPTNPGGVRSSPLPQRIDIEQSYIDKDNVDTFLKKRS